MREIKFKAFDIQNKRFMECDSLEGLFAHYENRSIELMQFTGLYDKNGKEIYEGDIVKWSNEMGFVVYHKEYGRFSVAWKTDLDNYLENGFHGTARLLKNEEDPLEIIGNIYENPGLLSIKN
jgi:uncharacterized phage protein (TIGR01671 family)